jgi:hypothetical protein
MMPFAKRSEVGKTELKKTRDEYEKRFLFQRRRRRRRRSAQKYNFPTSRKNIIFSSLLHMAHISGVSEQPEKLFFSVQLSTIIQPRTHWRYKNGRRRQRLSRSALLCSKAAAAAVICVKVKYRSNLFRFTTRNTRVQKACHVLSKLKGFKTKCNLKNVL